MKKIISWALTVCMLATMFAFAPQAVPTAKAAARDNCTGTHGSGWKAISEFADFGASVNGSGKSGYYSLPGGKYYLTDNITVDMEMLFTAGVTICLNGYDMHFSRTDAYRNNTMVSISSTLNFALCDCSEGHTGTVTAEQPTTGAMFLSVNNSTFDFYGGTIKDIYAGAIGGIIYLQSSGATVNIYDGAKISGCTAPNNTNATNMNAIIYTRKGGGTTINMYGGEISDNLGRGGIFTIYNGSTFNMYGGTIKDNSSNWCGVVQFYGGTTATQHAYFNMYGGVIENNTGTGTSAGGGGGICNRVTASDTAPYFHFHMYGGTIRNNHHSATTATNWSSATTNMSTAGNFVFFGGTVEGDGNETSSKHVVRGTYAYPFTVNGDIMTYGGAAGTYGTNDVAAPATKNGATYTMADQTLRVTDEVTSLTWLKDPVFRPKFVLDSDITADWLNEIAADENITLDLNGHTFTVNKEGSDITVADGGSLTIMDSAGGGKLVGTVNGVPYYRSRTVTLTENTSDDSLATIAFDEDVTLDLNGCTYTGVISNAGKLTIQDSATGGTLLGYVTNTATGTLTQTGGVMKRILTEDVSVESVDWELGTNAIIDVHGNTLTVTNDIVGTVLIIDSVGGGAFNGTVNGAPVSFGTMITLTEDIESAELATIAAGDKVILDLNGFNYTVTGGVITNAGDLTIMDSGSDGTLIGYVTNTGDGVLTQTGGVMMRILTDDVDFATAEEFDMALGTNAVIDLAGFTLSCSNADQSNPIDVYGDLTVMDSSDSTGTVSAFRFMVRDGGTFTLNGGTIRDNNLPNGSSSGYSGQAVYVAAGGTFIMNGGEISNNRMSGTNGGKSPNGTVYVLGTFNMNGGEIKSNKARTGSGVTVATGGVFNLYDGSVKSNSYTTMGGDVYIGAGGTVNVYGGHLGTNSEGTQYVALYSGSSTDHATLNIYAGHVGNIATRGSGYEGYQDVNVYGGEVYGICTSSGYYGGNFYIYGGEFRAQDKLDIPAKLAAGIALTGEDLAVEDVGGTYRYQIVHTFGQEANMLLSNDMTFFMYFKQADSAWTFHNAAGTTVYTPATATVTMPGRAPFNAPITTEGGKYKIAIPVYAKEMADEIIVDVKDSIGGTITTVSDSVKAYAARILSTSESAVEQALMVDMLNYGAAAQTYFNYNTGAPANADLTPELLALATSVTLEQDTSTFNHPVAYHSANLQLDENIDFNMYFWVAQINAENKGYTVYKNGTEYATGTFSETLDTATNLYVVPIEGVTLADIGGAIFEIEFTEKSGTTIRAKDTLSNYLARNDGLSIDSAPQSYEVDKTNGDIISEGEKTATDTSNLYAFVKAFATSAAAYAAV